MLRRLTADNCLPEATVSTFFHSLETEIGAIPLSAGLGAQQRAKWAKDRVIAAITAAEQSVCAQGPEIPAGTFATLLRIRPARVYQWCLPAPMRAKFLREFNITLGAWSMASDPDLRLWIESHQATYSGPIETGGKSGPAFVTDAAKVPNPAPVFAEFQDLLGLTFTETDRTLGLLWRYSRQTLENEGYRIRLPRSFDGLDYEPFAMEPDCTAPHGRTRRSDGQAGLPEAVHTGCQIPGRPFIELELVT